MKSRSRAKNCVECTVMCAVQNQMVKIRNRGKTGSGGALPCNGEERKHIKATNSANVMTSAEPCIYPVFNYYIKTHCNVLW